jgi:hypothetical protein
MKTREKNKGQQSGNIKPSTLATLRVIRAGGKRRHKSQDTPDTLRREGGNMLFMGRINLKGGSIMKTKRNIRHRGLIIGVLVLLFAYHTVPAALAQGGPDFSGWHTGMAMSALAEQKNKTNEQKVAKDNQIANVQHICDATEDVTEYLKSHSEKDTTRK